MHIAERTQVHLAQQGVRFDVVGILLDLILRGVDCLADAADLEIQVGETVLEELRCRIGVERELVLFHGLRGVVRPAIGCGKFLIQMR